MKQALKFLFIIISLVLGATFIYSAYSKTLPIQSFEFNIVDSVHLPWMLASFLARFFVGLEAALGVLMIIHFYGNRKWVLKVALALLAVFSVYLLYLWTTKGNNVNCGCFGDQLWMSPAASLVKNLVMIALLALLIRYHKGISFQRSWVVDPMVFIAIIAGVFVYQPMVFEKQAWLGKESYKLDLAPLYEQGKKDSPAIDLAHGKHIICFFSLGCPHCRKAALKIHIMKEQNPNLPFYMVLVGADKNFKAFFDETRATNIPYTRLEEEPFKHIVQKVENGQVIIAIPQIDWVNNSMVEAQASYITLDRGEIEKWLAK
jgi:thiol-disulfide isomerase/thioredoxin